MLGSPGGVVSSGLAVYDTMQFIQSEVSTICIGQAGSLGSLLLAAVETAMERDNFMGPAAAQAFGLIDHIITQRDLAPGAAPAAG